MLCIKNVYSGLDHYVIWCLPLRTPEMRTSYISEMASLRKKCEYAEHQRAKKGPVQDSFSLFPGYYTAHVPRDSRIVFYMHVLQNAMAESSVSLLST